jgi:pimeloyl-ACP methyl ester carboxylesterase
MLDWLALHLSPVYLGLGVPRGDGSPVVLVPGFLTTDAYLAEMYFWLRRIGYAPHFSGIGVNAGCVHTLTDRLEKTIVGVHDDTGRPIRIIGHSLGGFLARKVALRRPEIVSHVISLAAPIQSLEAHPAIMNAAGLARAYSAHPQPQEWLGTRLREDCECHADHCVPSPPPSVHRAAIYSRNDGVIDWRNCLEPDPALNHEVGGTHIGLVFNPCAYRIIAKSLAQTGPKPSPGPAKRAKLTAA